MKLIERETYYIKVGQNAKENFYLIDQAQPDSLWFHLDNHPSPHVILSPKKGFPTEYTNSILLEAACACKENSKLKNSSKLVRVIYLPISKIKKNKKLGEVTLLADAKYLKV